MEPKKESIHTYKKTRDRALLPAVFIALAAALLFLGRGLWYHNINLIFDALIYAGGAGFFYVIYRKTWI